MAERKESVGGVLSLLREGSLLIRRVVTTVRDVKKLSSDAQTARATKQKLHGENLCGEVHLLTCFFRDVLRVEASFDELPCPCATSSFDLLCGMVPALTCNSLYAAWDKLFPCQSIFDRAIDEQIDRHERSATAGAYLFRVSGSVETDVETRGSDAIDIKKKRLSTITLPEMMVCELYHHYRTRGGHLNLLTSTLCAGTRCKDGSVPVVYFEGRKVHIDTVLVRDREKRTDCGPRLVVAGMR